jgi:hypothetical protein
VLTGFGSGEFCFAHGDSVGSPAAFGGFALDDPGACGECVVVSGFGGEAGDVGDDASLTFTV